MWPPAEAVLTLSGLADAAARLLSVTAGAFPVSFPPELAPLLCGLDAVRPLSEMAEGRADAAVEGLDEAVAAAVLTFEASGFADAGRALLLLAMRANAAAAADAAEPRAASTFVAAEGELIVAVAPATATDGAAAEAGVELLIACNEAVSSGMEGAVAREEIATADTGKAASFATAASAVPMV